MEAWQNAESAMQRADFRTAAAHYKEVIEILPYEPTSRFRLACCLAELREADSAISQLESAIRYGWNDSQAIRENGQWAALRETLQFENLIQAAEHCEREEFLVHRGEHVDADRPAPVLVLLHGLGCGPRAEIPYWSAAADELGWIVVAPRGRTKFGPMLFGWNRPEVKDSFAADYFDVESAKASIDAVLQAAREKHSIDESRIYLAGFSQGAGVALHLLRETKQPYRGAVVVCGLVQSAGADAWRTSMEQTPIRVAIIAGSLDRLLPRSQALIEELKSAAVPHQYWELRDVGHEYPPDYATRLRTALEFIAIGESPMPQ
jgi:phospholipase/carboxylesterase